MGQDDQELLLFIARRSLAAYARDFRLRGNPFAGTRVEGKLEEQRGGIYEQNRHREPVQTFASIRNTKEGHFSFASASPKPSDGPTLPELPHFDLKKVSLAYQKGYPA